MAAPGCDGLPQLHHSTSCTLVALTRLWVAHVNHLDLRHSALNIRLATTPITSSGSVAMYVARVAHPPSTQPKPSAHHSSHL